jgi:ACT domain-containing protein
MNKTEQHKKAILEALEKSLGVVTTACKKVGVGRTTFYGWLKDDKDFADKVNDIQNIALDFVESKLFENIREGKTSEMIFYLKTKGKKRGYVERQEITGADGMPTNFQIEIIDNIEDTD